MKHWQLLLILFALALPLAAQVNGNLQYIGDKAILQVWGDHYQRGYAQGYLLAQPTLDVFDEFFYMMFVFSDPARYAYLWNYYQEHFNTDARMLQEAQGLVAGIAASGASLYHSGLQRDITHDDILLANAFLDLQQLRNDLGGPDIDLGCASLSSWGISTQQDSLLTGSSVITRWLDWTLFECLIDNPLLVVHHPSEPDEQKWLSFTFPGWLGAASAISESGTWASLNVGNDHSVVNQSGLDPIFFDIRRGLERTDLNGDGVSNIMDVAAAIQAGNNLTGTIIHSLSESAGQTISVVIENNNTGTALRYYDDPSSNLPGQNLAATNHFRLLTFPTCCTRYANIADSLNMNHHITAKRQWSLLSGAAGQETTLTALQYTPSTGSILWAGAAVSLPANQNPAIHLSASDLFSFSTPVTDELLPSHQFAFSCAPNPVSAAQTLRLSGSQPLKSLALYNLRGQKILDLSFSGNKSDAEISLPALPAGVYLAWVQGVSGSSAQSKLLVLP